MSNYFNQHTDVISALSPELQALIHGLRGQAPAAELSLDWAQVCQLAVAHNVAPLLHRSWASMRDSIPAAVLSDLGVLRRQSQKQGLLGLRQRDEVVHLLWDAGVQPIVLKGSAWARRWYTDVSLRPFNDIDLLLPTTDLPRAREALLSAGYRDTGAWGASHHDMPLEHPDRPCSIELHRYLLALPVSRELTFDDVVRCSVTLGGKDTGVRTLGCEDTLLHLCMHLLQHVESEPGWRLLNVWDIAQHLKSCSVRWDVFAQRLFETGVTHACSAALGLVAALTGAAIPPAYCDMASGRRLIGFPFMRYSLTPVRHRGVLSLVDVLSHPKRWQGMPASIAASLRRRAPVHGPSLDQLADKRAGGGSFPLRYLPSELWWLLQEILRLERGRLLQGIRQLRWEDEARDMVYDLLPDAVEIPEDLPTVAERTVEERVWPARP